MRKFLILKNPKSDSGQALTDFVNEEPVTLGEAPRCPSCGSYIGMLPWLPPYRAELEVWATEYGDIAFGTGGNLLVTERFEKAYRRSGLTGLVGFEPVKITRVVKRGAKGILPELPEYFCTHPVRSNALVDHDASELELQEPWRCEECRSGLIQRAKRIVLVEGTWSGEDVFIARGLPGTTIVTDRFRDFFERNRINNGILIPAEEYSFDFYPRRGTKNHD